MADILTQERVREVLEYDPETGICRWLVTLSHRAMAGSVAGSITPKGYRAIYIDRRNCLLHRIIWLYVFGTAPKQIDHKNGIRCDNRLSNLREATSSQNGGNQRRPRNNTSGFKGVHLAGDRWRARIVINRRSISLGMFATPDEAHTAYMNAAVTAWNNFARAE